MLEAETMMNLRINQVYIGKALSVVSGNASQYLHVFTGPSMYVSICLYVSLSCLFVHLFVCLAMYLFPLFSIFNGIL